MQGFISMVMNVIQAAFLLCVIGLQRNNHLPWVGALCVSASLSAAPSMLCRTYSSPTSCSAPSSLCWGICLFVGMLLKGSRRTIRCLIFKLTFQLIVGGPIDSIGTTASLIIAGMVTCVTVVMMLFNSRHQIRCFEFPLQPVWIEYSSASSFAL